MAKNETGKIPTLATVDTVNKDAQKPVETCEPAQAAAAPITGPKYITKCIYFPDRTKVLRLEENLNSFPRATLSTVMAQLLDPVNKAMADLPKGKRQVEIKALIWI